MSPVSATGRRSPSGVHLMLAKYPLGGSDLVGGFSAIKLGFFHNRVNILAESCGFERCIIRYSAHSQVSTPMNQ
jgi:hypothetical protein